MKCYPEEKDEEQMRRSLGRYGLTGKQQVLVRRGIHSEEFLYDGTSYCVYQAHLLHTYKLHRIAYLHIHQLHPTQLLQAHMYG